MMIRRKGNVHETRKRPDLRSSDFLALWMRLGQHVQAGGNPRLRTKSPVMVVAFCAVPMAPNATLEMYEERDDDMAAVMMLRAVTMTTMMMMTVVMVTITMMTRMMTGAWRCLKKAMMMTIMTMVSVLMTTTVLTISVLMMPP